MIAGWSFPEGEGHFTLDTATGRLDKVQFALLNGRFQAPQNPVWRKGITNSALLFDGYSTYLRRPAAEVLMPSAGLTITAWVAPRTYEYGAEGRLAAIANQHNREKAEGYLLGVTRHGEWSLQLGLGGEWTEIWSREQVLPLNRWSHVCATYDQAASLLKLYLNGTEVASRQLEQSAGITSCGEDLVIGRNNHGVVLAESFIMNHFDGLMDEIMIYDRALSADEVRRAVQSALAPHEGVIPVPDPKELKYPRELWKDDRHRPQFHLTPPGHWMNEPHGPIYFNGRYHLFYQYNLNGPFWHYIHWGHWVSEDLVHWRDLPPALSPEPRIDPDGVWSGSATYDENGIPVLFFTAGNNERSPNQSVGLARSTYPQDGDLDLVRWNKLDHPVVVQERGIGLFGEFRDPFVWKDGSRWVMLVGSGVEGLGGTALVYVSADLTEWEYKGPLFVSDYIKYPHLGVAWELPVLLPLRREGENTGKHIFLICPWGTGIKPDVTYWLGTFDPVNLRFTPDHEEPRLIDVGDVHFTGPSGMVDPATGRTILFTIAQGERTPEIDYDCGWSHTGGIPVSLSLRQDDRLGVEPIQEMEKLRDRLLLELHDVKLDEINRHLQDIQGDMVEIEIVFRDGTAEHIDRYGVSLRRSPEGEEETVVYYDRHQQKLWVDRSKSTLDNRERPTGIQGGSLHLNQEPLRLHIFVDRSLIEAYVSGLKSLTTRTYPSRTDACGIRLYSDGNPHIETIKIWSMQPAFSD
ncbi:GH32 C-terminal domain-containing protein [Paenibacillus sp. sptzw28]|nr:GH32 C-terminal domain-containing protein [Paenibacillus sp. sptzw28]